MSHTMRLATAACAAAVLVGLAAPAHAAEDDFQYVGFIAPTAGQSVLMEVRAAGSTGAWSSYCFRWAGGTNVGEPTSALSGMEAWNDYLQGWEGAGGWSKPHLAWSVKAALYTGGKCDGAQVGEQKELPAPRPKDGSAVYWVDFR